MLEEVRTSCAKVMARATWVQIDHERLAAYAANFSPAERRDPIDEPPLSLGTRRGDARDAEERVALVMTLDAINFGSGYHPVVRKRPGCSGAVTMATAVRDWTERTGPITAARLVALTASDTHLLFDQPHDDGPCTELMTLFAEALNDLGRAVAACGSFTQFVERAERSADRLVAQLDQLAFFHDRAVHEGQEVLFFKRAQITAADLAREFHGTGLGAFDDLDRLTAFADNLVPHVLRIDGVLTFAPELVARIERGELLTAGAADEVEIRAAGVHGVELLRAELAAQGHLVRSSRLDEVLWTRGGSARSKAVPRHRCRCVFY